MLLFAGALNIVLSCSEAGRQGRAVASSAGRYPSASHTPGTVKLFIGVPSLLYRACYPISLGRISLSFPGSQLAEAFPFGRGEGWVSGSDAPTLTTFLFLDQHGGDGNKDMTHMVSFGWEILSQWSLMKS